MLIKFVKVFALFFVLLAGTVFFVFSGSSEPVLVEIPRGSTSKDIASILARHDLIRLPFSFRLLAKVSGKSRSLKQGFYQLRKNNPWETLSAIAAGRTYKVKVNIPEGWTSRQIAVRLQEAGVLEGQEAFAAWVEKNRREGALFPETYFFELKSAPEKLGTEMFAMFRKNYGEEFNRRANELGLTELQVLTMASIIEREARLDSERALVSSVYHNRLKKKWLLEADPTVQYAVSGGRFWKDLVTYKDLKVDSPYNTYRRRGLPPGPICNPGLESIRAALYPAPTGYLFFIADGNGGHYFFSSYLEHLEKRKELRKSRRPAKIGRH